MCSEFAEWATLTQQINKPSGSGKGQWSNKIVKLYNVTTPAVDGQLGERKI